MGLLSSRARPTEALVVRRRSSESLFVDADRATAVPPPLWPGSQQQHRQQQEQVEDEDEEVGVERPQRRHRRERSTDSTISSERKRPTGPTGSRGRTSYWGVRDSAAGASDEDEVTRGVDSLWAPPPTWWSSHAFDVSSTHARDTLAVPPSSSSRSPSPSPARDSLTSSTLSSPTYVSSVGGSATPDRRGGRGVCPAAAEHDDCNDDYVCNDDYACKEELEEEEEEEDYDVEVVARGAATGARVASIGSSELRDRRFSEVGRSADVTRVSSTSSSSSSSSSAVMRAWSSSSSSVSSVSSSLLLSSSLSSSCGLKMPSTTHFETAEWVQQQQQQQQLQHQQQLRRGGRGSTVTSLACIREEETEQDDEDEDDDDDDESENAVPSHVPHETTTTTTATTTTITNTSLRHRRDSHVVVDVLCSTTGNLQPNHEVSNFSLSNRSKSDASRMLARTAPCPGSFVFRASRGHVVLSLWDGSTVRDLPHSFDLVVLCVCVWGGGGARF
jgi:hypothetical protein